MPSVSQRTRKGNPEELKILEDPRIPKIQTRVSKIEPLFAVRVVRLGVIYGRYKIHRGASDHECRKSQFPPAVEKWGASPEARKILRAMT